MTKSARSATDREPAPLPADLPVWVRAGLAVVIVAGLAMRVVEPGRTVFCEDQANACALAEDIVAGQRPSGGLVNSGSFRNPPGFAYLLAGVWALWPGPMALVVFTGAVNILAVLAAAWLIARWVGKPVAWWAVAFLAAGPWPIHYSRWIWAQHLLFPAALVAYFFLWRWFVLGRRWALLGLLLALLVVIQIHLAGAALILAVAGVWLIRRRPRPAPVPLALGLLAFAVLVAMYLWSGNFRQPNERRFGYQHAWRVLPAAAMSVSGLGWQLEYRSGYAAFVREIGWRRWPYECVMMVPAGLLAAGLAMAIRRRSVRRLESARVACDSRLASEEALSLIAALVLLIPLAFAAMGTRTSPTYLPVWYPLPFVLIGLATCRLTCLRGPMMRSAMSLAGLTVLAVELAFFAEQLRYIGRQGGVPGSPLGQTYASLAKDVKSAVKTHDPKSLREVWMVYEGRSPIQAPASTYLFRHEFAARPAAVESGERVLLHFAGRYGASAGWVPSGQEAWTESLSPDTPPPPEAYLVFPWSGPQQQGAIIPRQPNR